MGEEMDGINVRHVVIAALLSMAIGALCALLVTGCSRPAYAVTPRGEGQPLDATQHTAPSFACGNYSYHVTDRTTGATWWLVQMPEGDGHWRWVVLDEGEYSKLNEVLDKLNQLMEKLDE